MKTKKMILLLTILIPLFLHAQCLDCDKKENDWEFAAGVTVYSNNHYVTWQNSLERQPLEFNFRYKLGGNHILRASLPIVWKANKHGEPELVYLPTGKVFVANSLEEYLEVLHDKDWNYASYTKPLHYYESLYGVSIGYDYDFPVWKSVSIFGGVNVAYYYSTVHSKFYEIDYYALDEEHKSKIGLISLKNKILSRSTFNVNPVLGVRYQFQKLLFEANIGYNFLRSVTGIKDNNSHLEGSSGIMSDHSRSRKLEPNTGKYPLYNFSIYYAF